MREVLFTVCGRAGSKGVRGKNTRDFLGVPLVYYTLAAIELAVEGYDGVEPAIALSTDSPELVELVRRSGVEFLEVPRPEALAGDTASKVDVIAHTMREAERVRGRSFGCVVDLDITSPLRTADDVRRVLARREESDADTVFTVTGSRRNPCFNMVRRNAEGYYERVLPSEFNTRQEAPRFYDMNASIYAYRPGFLRSGKQIFEGACDVVEMRDTAVLDLDDPEDFELMEVVARHLYDSEPRYSEVAARARGLQEGPRPANGDARLLASYTSRQLELFGGGSPDLTPHLAEALSRTLACFGPNTNKYFREDRVDPLHSGQYAIFLCYLARVAYEMGAVDVAKRVYLLNKALHGFDVFYEVELPRVFFMEHPVGTVLGRARYSDGLFVGQNVTVGGNGGRYPTIGRNVALHAGCIVVGDTVIGDNVEVSAGSFIRDERIPDNCLVFGQSPNLAIRPRSREEMQRRLYYFDLEE